MLILFDESDIQSLDSDPPIKQYGQPANNAVHFEDAMSEIARVPTKITELDADAGHLIR